MSIDKSIVFLIQDFINFVIRIFFNWSVLFQSSCLAFGSVYSIFGFAFDHLNTSFYWQEAQNKAETYNKYMSYQKRIQSTQI